MWTEAGHGRSNWPAWAAAFIRSNIDTAVVRASGSAPLVGLCKRGGDRSQANDESQRAEPHSCADPHQPSRVVRTSRNMPHG